MEKVALMNGLICFYLHKKRKFTVKMYCTSAFQTSEADHSGISECHNISVLPTSLWCYRKLNHGFSNSKKKHNYCIITLAKALIKMPSTNIITMESISSRRQQ